MRFVLKNKSHICILRLLRRHHPLWARLSRLVPPCSLKALTPPALQPGTKSAANSRDSSLSQILFPITESEVMPSPHNTMPQSPQMPSILPHKHPREPRLSDFRSSRPVSTQPSIVPTRHCADPVTTEGRRNELLP